ncbi:hypothetical protein PR048_000970 [Dryococelus australis]|uniref:HAT C-terminal dimerisation domain-containing protein n=1 Tax=Dryococelus australis TaxID=614101 RepID=A0ABQ9IG71_9NEOP|nr:hypothetical protein PR048_000970 [Dryococelus australis]
MHCVSFSHVSGLLQVIERSSIKVWITTTCSKEVTRWDSCYNMLERLVEQQEAVQNFTRKISGLCSFSPADWTLAENIVELLRLFKDATLALSKENCILSKVIPIINSLRCGLQMQRSRKDTALKNTVCDMHYALERRFLDMEANIEQYAAETILDPRYKNRVFKNSGSAELAAAWIHEQLAANVTKEKTKVAPTPQPLNEVSVLQQICAELILMSDASHTKTDAPNELTQYLAEPTISLSDDPLTFWRENVSLPNLKLLTQKKLGIPPVSVASEGLFNTSNKTCTKKQNCLSSQNVQILIFFTSKLKFNILKHS